MTCHQALETPLTQDSPPEKYTHLDNLFSSRLPRSRDQKHHDFQLLNPTKKEQNR